VREIEWLMKRGYSVF